MKRAVHLREDVFGVFNLDSTRTGLPCDIRSEPKGCQGQESYSHSSRIKISVPESSKIPFELLPEVHTVNTKSVRQAYNKLSQSQQSNIQRGVKYVQRNVDLFLAHYNDTDDKNEFGGFDLMLALNQRGEFKIKDVY